MRAIWKGAVAFGLVNVPVRLYAATGEHEVRCTRCTARTAAASGTASSAASTASRSSCRTSPRATRPTTASWSCSRTRTSRRCRCPPSARSRCSSSSRRTRSTRSCSRRPTTSSRRRRPPSRTRCCARRSRETDRMALVKVALRQRESMAVLRVRDDVIVLQTMLWPDEVREADFPVLDDDVTVRPQELAMASSLVESLAADFDPSQYEDPYAGALEQLIEAKVSLREHALGARARRRGGRRGRRRRGRRPAGRPAAQRREGARCPRRGTHGRRGAEAQAKSKPKPRRRDADEDEPTPRKTRRKAS